MQDGLYIELVPKSHAHMDDIITGVRKGSPDGGIFGFACGIMIGDLDD